jgi:hypothetical protein
MFQGVFMSGDKGASLFPAFISGNMVGMAVGINDKKRLHRIVSGKFCDDAFRKLRKFCVDEQQTVFSCGGNDIGPTDCDQKKIPGELIESDSGGAVFFFLTIDQSHENQKDKKNGYGITCHNWTSIYFSFFGLTFWISLASTQ